MVKLKLTVTDVQTEPYLEKSFTFTSEWTGYTILIYPEVQGKGICLWLKFISGKKGINAIVIKKPSTLSSPKSHKAEYYTY